jgi:ribonuclease BN (tRNA processing enzyme)
MSVLGAGPAYTDRRGAAAAAFLVRARGASLLLDLGQGAFSNLAATLEPSTLAAVVVSHLHPDHFIDLVSLRHYLRFEFAPPRRVPVLGPAGLDDRLDALHAEPGFTAGSLDVETLGEGERRIGPFIVETRLIQHTEESYGTRVSVAAEDSDGGGAGGAGAPRGAAAAVGGSPGSGRGLVYSGDCSRAEDLLPLIRPGDVLLTEATFGAGPVPKGAEHITSADAARVAAASGASRLLLTHILAGHSRAEALSAAQAAFSGPVQLVTEGDRFEI